MPITPRPKLIVLLFYSNAMSNVLKEENSYGDHISKRTPIDTNIDRDSSLRYWNETPATANAMLGDLGNFTWYSRIDLRGSANFLAKVRRLSPDL